MMKLWANHFKINLKEVRLNNIDAGINLAGIKGEEGQEPDFTHIKGEMEIVSDADDATFEKFREQCEKTCPVYNLVRKAGVDV